MTHFKECPCPECQRRRKNRTEFFWVTVVVLALILCGLFFGCASRETVTPPPVHSTQASFDGGQQTSGILEARPDGFVISIGFRARYNALVETYGGRFLPALERDAGLTQLSPSTWFIDAQHMEQFLRMNTWRKSGR